MGGLEDCEELSLELSIGGKYGKAENLREKARDENVQCEEISRCDFSGFLETMDPQRRREIQALRRQEARRKREGKVKKSRGMNVEVDKLFLEAHKFQGRVRDREIREKDSFLGGKSRQNGEVGEELRLSLFSEEKQKRENGWLYPKVQLVSMNSSDSKNSDIGVKSMEQCASAVSDYHSMSHKGGSSSSSDTGSQSQPRAVVEQMGGHDSSASSSSGGGVNAGGGGGLPRMPCVSAIGNGPNGRRVTGFLYRYDKGTEVSIVCVCHGSSFSPAEFVRHAGGVDVAHPLRHITVVPPSVVILNDKYCR